MQIQLFFFIIFLQPLSYWWKQIFSSADDKKILLGYKLKFSDHLSDMLNIALALKFHALTNR